MKCDDQAVAAMAGVASVGFSTSGTKGASVTTAEDSLVAAAAGSSV